MTAIDVNADDLATAAALSAHAYEQAIIHVGEEIKARDITKLDPLVNSLADEGPYAYTIMPEVRPEGSVRCPVLTTRDEIRGAYEFVRGLSDLHEVVGLSEVRGAWYLFQDNMTRGSLKGSDDWNTRQTLSLFPSGAGTGITGELVWLRVPKSQLGAPDEVDITDDDELLAREQVHTVYGRYLDGLRANDLEAVLEVFHDGIGSAVRDYVEATGTLAELTGKDAHRSWYESFFEKFEVRSVEPLVLLTQPWYVFAELRVTLAVRETSTEVSFNTAEFHVTAKDGRFIARIGHGTEPV